MDRLKRIEYMEAILTEAEEVLPRLRQALAAYEQLSGRLAELADYYGGPLWRQDFDDDRAGKLPRELRRGVLSEDGIWNVLADRDAALQELEEVLRAAEKTR